MRTAGSAAVVCRPFGVSQRRAGFSSGAIVHPSGLVLSDGDAGLVWRPGSQRSWQDRCEIRLLQDGRQRVFEARVIVRDRDVDTTLLRIVDPPADLPFVALGHSHTLAVGDYVLAVGTAFDESGVAPPTVTAGVVATFDAAAGAKRTSQDASFLYMTAAVNQGVNGGPVVDLAGRLVGTVSTYLDPKPDEPHAYLGRVVPIDRVREVLARHPEASAIDFAVPGAIERIPEAGRALERTVRAAARRAWPAVASLTVQRRNPVRSETLLEDRIGFLPRFNGPVTGFLVGRDGLVVTSLYNVTNVAERVRPLWMPPDGADLTTGLADVLSATVHLGDGRSLAARYVGHDLRTGIALFRIDAPSSGAALPAGIAPAPAQAAERGRLVVALGHPYGPDRPADPLLVTGVLGKWHGDRAGEAWRGQWQTDAPGLDANVGGPALDLEGRLLGMMTIWHPARHGRGSGVAFIVPWSAIDAAIAGAATGNGSTKGILGVQFGAGRRPVLTHILGGRPGAAAGLLVGDRVLHIDDIETDTVADARSILAHRYAGEVVRLGIQRGNQRLEIAVTLDASP